VKTRAARVSLNQVTISCIDEAFEHLESSVLDPLHQSGESKTDGGKAQ
jgi:hypothetical protein